MMDIEIKKIRRDGGTQSRANINNDVVAEYADAMRAEVKFPPVTLFYDGKAYWLADGFHRVAAAIAAGLSSIDADVRQGTQREAVLHSVGVNAAHGLRRTNEDKRRAVEVLLRDKEWRVWSDREIARQAGVDHKTVGKLRSELVQSGEIPHTIAPVMYAKSEKFVQDNGAGHTFAPDITDNPDIEAARQIAIKALDLWPVNALESRLENGEDGNIDGVPYRIGHGQLNDPAGGVHDVGAAHVAVALTTNNGGFVYRFDARQLAAWIEARAALAKAPETISMLYRVYNGAVYVGYSEEKDSIRFGLVTKVNGKLYLTVFGRCVIDTYLEQNPKLKLEHLIRTVDELDGGFGEGIKHLETIYASQKKSARWVGIVPSWHSRNMADWANAFSDRGMVVIEKREVVGMPGAKEMIFCIVSDSGAKLIDKPALETPPSPPVKKYHVDAEIFIDPDATFTVKAGDTVKFKGRVGRVDSLQEWPALKVRLPGQYWLDTWYDNKIEIVQDGGIDLVEQAELDRQTQIIWSRSEDLLNALRGWKSDEADDPHGMDAKEGALAALSQLMSWVSDTFSGQRLKLELPAELEEVDG